MKKTPKIAIIRGSQPRMTEALFYSNFRRFKVKMVGDKSTGWIVEKDFPKNVEFIDTPLYPIWGLDPWTRWGGRLQVHRSFQFVSNLENLIKDCDVVNVSDLFYFYCWQTAMLKEKYNKKLVAIVWETLPKHLSTYLPPYCFGVAKMLKNTDLFVARSSKARSYLLSIGADANKIKVIYKGINLDSFKPAKTKKSNRVVRILYVGQLVASKGLHELLQAFEKLHKEFDNIELVLSGKSKGENLEREIRRLSEKFPIKLHVQVDYNLVPDLYRSADIYCQLSQDWKYLGLISGGNDWFPYTVMEAMASGLPVVATRVGGISEQLGNNGVYVQQKNVDSVYRALKRLVIDGNLRRKIGKENRIRAQKLFDIKKQAKLTEDAILKIL